MPDLVLRNARIWTNDSTKPWADTAIARAGQFAFVGNVSEASLPAEAKTFDARGRLVVPGFTDGHAHLLGTGLGMSAVDLKGALDAAGAARRVGDRARGTTAGAWIRGAGWDQHRWPGGRFPDRGDLDRVTGDHPVVLTHTSGHCTWVNTAALRIAGIKASTAAPFGGAIDIGDDGEPSGILRDNASQLIGAVVPPATPPERVAALEVAIAHAHSLGVTGAHAMNVGRGEYQALLTLRETGRLRLRVHAFMGADKLDEWFDRNLRTGDGDDFMRIGGIKFFSDGALGSLTAWMIDPYKESEDMGLPLYEPAELEDKVRACLDHGLAPAIHAIGDRANREVLDIYDRLRDVAPRLPRRIEHAQLLGARDVARMEWLRVTASVQPIHATQDMAKVDRHWGSRGSGAYVFSALLASGVNLAFGSDTPVETMDPLAGIHAATTRRNAGGEPADGWYPAERIDLAAALDAYTGGCARAVRNPTGGCIAAGADADFTVLSQDLFALDDPMRIIDTRADLTCVAGEVVYDREGA